MMVAQAFWVGLWMPLLRNITIAGAFGSGKSLAINGIIATNLILSKAGAYIVNSNISTTTKSDIAITEAGDLILNAKKYIRH